MNYQCPECPEIVEENGSTERGDEIVKCYTCKCGCVFDVTYRDPVVNVTTHGDSWNGKDN